MEVDKVRTNDLAVANSENPDDVKIFLLGLGLRVDAAAVFRVLSVLQNKTDISFYDLYTHGRYRDGTQRNPICGKGTAYKIKSRYEDGRLNPLLEPHQADEPALSEIPAVLSIYSVAFQSPSRGALRAYGENPILWSNVLVTNNSENTVHGVELWVPDVSREPNGDKGPGDVRKFRDRCYFSVGPWTSIPLAWPTGEVRISIPPGGTRNARLLWCDDENGRTLLLQGASGTLKRIESGVLRIELEVFSPDVVTTKSVVSVRVTPRSFQLKERELHKDADPAFESAYRRCKVILNEPGLAWRPIIDLRKVPRRVAASQAGSKARTVYEKIADSYIAAHYAVKNVPSRHGRAVVDPRINKLEELRSEVGEDVWFSLLPYFTIYESPARIIVEPWEKWWFKDET